jgi:hypothetical protein
VWISWEVYAQNGRHWRIGPPEEVSAVLLRGVYEKRGRSSRRHQDRGERSSDEHIENARRRR